MLYSYRKAMRQEAREKVVRPSLIIPWCKSPLFQPFNFQPFNGVVRNPLRRIAWYAPLWLGILIWLVGCQQTTSTPAPSPTQVTTFIPIEVTRIVTPTPGPLTCPRG